MLVGVPKEIKNREYRVGMIPSSVRELVRSGHQVMVQTRGGESVGFSDSEYKEVGAEIVGSAEEVFERAELVVKVKEPQEVERRMLRRGQLLFTFLHLAPDPEQAAQLLESGSICIAYETITAPGGGLPLLAPMSEIAGRMSSQIGSYCLGKPQGGAGVLLGGVPGVEPAKVVIVGGGVVGVGAATIAVGMGARVIILDRSLEVLRRIDVQFGSKVETVFSNTESLERHLLDADLVVGGVLVPGAKAPKLITRKMVESMKLGSVIVDVAIDQGGCAETSRATTHDDPTYVVDGVVHYCVANMPGAFARTSAISLNNATLPYLLRLANQGYREAFKEDDHFLNGLNILEGKLTCREVSESLGLDYYDPKNII